MSIKIAIPEKDLICNKGNADDVRCTLSYIDADKLKGNEYYIELLNQSIKAEKINRKRSTVIRMLEAKLKKLQASL